jgi:hypothetical protein
VTAPPPSPPAPPAPPGPPGPMRPARAPAVPGPGKALPSPFVAVVGYTLRACLPLKRWLGVLLPCLGAVGLGLLSTLSDRSAEYAFGTTARQGLFGLIVPLTCLVVGDAVLGADIRAGTFPLTWLSPVPFRTIVIGRWLGGWLVTLVTLVPALALAAVVAGLPEAAGPMAVAGAFGAAAYIALFVFIGVVARRAAVWSLAVVFLGERLLGQALSGVAQLSPLWESGQAYAGLAEDIGGARLLRNGMPHGVGALVRLVIITVVCLGLAVWRIRHIRPGTTDE